MNKTANTDGHSEYVSRKEFLEFKDRVTSVVVATQENFESAQEQINERELENQEAIELIKNEIERVFAEVDYDINRLDEDSRILHEAVNDIDNEKSDLEDAISEIKVEIGQLRSSIQFLASEIRI